MNRTHTHLETANAHSPITAADLKAHLNIDASDDDTIMEGFINAAVKRWESDTNSPVMQSVWEVVYNHWPADGFVLPLGPMVSIDSIKYLDADGAEQTQTASTYTLMKQGMAPRVMLNMGQSAPVIANRENAVTLTVTAGYAVDNSADELAKIPADIVVALKILAAHFYENRNMLSAMQMYEVPASYQCIAQSYQVEYL